MTLSDNSTKISNLLTAINALPPRGTDTSDATATADKILTGYSAYGSAGTKLNGSYTPLDTSDADAGAGDIRSGKTAYVNGAKVTGTLVPPVDTGANGLYRNLLNGVKVTEIVSDEITKLPQRIQAGNDNLKKVVLPNVTSIGEYAFQLCSSLTGIIRLDKCANWGRNAFDHALKNTVKLYTQNQQLEETFDKSSGLKHLWLYSSPKVNFSGNKTAYRAYSLKSLEYSGITGTFQGYFVAQNASVLDTIILRTSSALNLGGTNWEGNFTIGGTGKIYVPASLMSTYSTATNWTAFYNSGQLIGIDEDTTATVGTAFTPTTAAAGIVSWDQVDLQSYSVGTADSSTGTIIPTHDGRLLIRGLDSNGDIVHVTYIQIGTGFDEEANLA